ncbi:HET-domain-containing protein [Lentithecium fluviatile CBS 122367]|uniref:HET-domain-containing protein n=1 Tax=Lentithecium fluviatile CBS 122367 TaxID=1168545 RepID=A0A6G1IML2_9PLEO|nr:HET-domain-containing protein [Lentithecium fluviatile CBS 122367]
MDQSRNSYRTSPGGSPYSSPPSSPPLSTPHLSQSRLFSGCNQIFSNPKVEESKYHDFEFNTMTGYLEKTAEAGCYVCTRIHAQIRKYQPSRCTSMKYVIALLNAAYFRVTLIYMSERHPGLQIPFYCFEEGDPPGPLTCSPLSIGTRSEEGMKQAREWLGDCVQNHRKCQQLKKHTTLPTRLVSITRTDWKLSARICDGSTLQSDTPYLTLSHCWGKDKFVTLSTENLSRFQHDIPIHKLSKVFQDALATTHELGYQYIWIDSL